MKRLGRIASGTIMAGLSALLPSCTMAGGWHESWRRDSDDHAPPQGCVDIREDHREGGGRGRWRRHRVVVVNPPPVCAPPPPPTPVCVLPDVDYNVDACNVPPVVMQQANCDRRGAVNESIQFVRRGGEEFYRFILDAGFGRHLNMRIMPGGKVLGIDAC